MSLSKKHIKNSLINVLSTVACLLIKLRYRVTLIGIEKIPKSSKGLLFLPNHPAEIDPFIIGSCLWKKYHPRPVVAETFYYMPFIGNIMRMINGFPIPDMSVDTGTYRKQRIDNSLDAVCAALQSGDSIILYPSGTLMSSGCEKIGGASGFYRLLQQSDTFDIVLVRTRGLWGSSFSTAQTMGSSPDFKQVCRHAAIVLLKNLILFTPRRKVTVEFATLEKPLTREIGHFEVNSVLEDFYNSKGGEPLSLVSYSFLTHDVPKIRRPRKIHHANIDHLPTEIVSAITASFTKEFKLQKPVSLDMKLSGDLGMDSIMISEIPRWLNAEYDVADVTVNELGTVADVAAFAAGASKPVLEVEKSISAIWNTSNRPVPSRPSGLTIQECFLRKCDEMKYSVAMADEIAGVLTWSKLKLAALIFAKIIRDYPGRYIGVMLPSSVIVTIIIFGVLLARKVPVMLNWTVGRRNLEDACSMTSVEVVITSKKFLDKLTDVNFGNVEDYFVFVEDIRNEKIRPINKFMALIQAKQSADTLIKKLDLTSISGSDQAVVLFTSGSESSPKGVPLSHTNILSMLQPAVEVLALNENSTMYSFLPPFHSFGFTVTTMLPLIFGIKVAFHPNPTEGRRLARGCKYYGITILFGTPAFINGIFKGATNGQLDSLKCILCGGDMLPEDVRTEVERLTNLMILEGYGVTECSPAISLNWPGEERDGVGRPLPGVKLKIVDIDSYSPLKQGEQGLILVCGPNVFSSYIGKGINPFVEIDGQRWYNTGDLGYLTKQGALVLSGRLKRFVKISGEMISLPAIESILAQHWPPSEDGPVIAVEALENANARPEIWLVASYTINIEDANRILKESGASNLLRINKVMHVDKIPTLGNGKTNYPELKQRMSKHVDVIGV